MPEKIGVIVSREYESRARAIAQRLGPCFDATFHVVAFPHAPMQNAFGDIPKHGRWTVLAIPLFQYPTVVPDLMYVMPSDKLLIAIGDERRAVATLEHYAANRLWIVLKLPDNEIIHWNRYHPHSREEEMTVMLECIGRSIPDDQYKSLRIRLEEQTPGISIKIVPG